MSDQMCNKCGEPIDNTGGTCFRCYPKGDPPLVAPDPHEEIKRLEAELEGARDVFQEHATALEALRERFWEHKAEAAAMRKALEVAHEGINRLASGEILGDHPGLDSAMQEISAALATDHDPQDLLYWMRVAHIMSGDDPAEITMSDVDAPGWPIHSSYAVRALDHLAKTGAKVTTRDSGPKPPYGQTPYGDFRAMHDTAPLTPRDET